MKVLHVYSHYHPDTFGGGEQLINQIAKGTARLGAQPRVLTLSYNPEPAHVVVDGHDVYRCRIDASLASNHFSWGALSQLRSLAKDVDLLHFYYPWPFGDLLKLIGRINKPYVVSQLSDIVKQRRTLRAIYAPIEWLFMRQAAAIVGTSPNYAASSPLLARWPEKVRVIPIGLDQSGYPPAEPARLQHWRRELGERFFLFVGVLRYYKGIDFLLDALPESGCRVVIAGAGPEEPRLRAKADSLALDNVRFLGRVSEPDKRALLELCEGFVFPSHLRAESFGISLLEAAVYGKPMISCEIGTGTTYVNLHEITGLVVPPANAPALRSAMQELWAAPALQSRYGAAARQRYEQVFGADVMALSYMALYRDILDTGS